MSKSVCVIVAVVLFISGLYIVLPHGEKPKEPGTQLNTEVELHRTHVENIGKLFDIVRIQGSRISELEDQLSCRDKVTKDLQEIVGRILGIIETRLPKLEARLDKIVADVKENFEFIRNVMNDHEHRLEKLSPDLPKPKEKR
jgi:hypothetical protein